MTPHPCETVRDLQREVAELRAQNAKLADDCKAYRAALDDISYAGHVGYCRRRAQRALGK